MARSRLAGDTEASRPRFSRPHPVPRPGSPCLQIPAGWVRPAAPPRNSPLLQVDVARKVRFLLMAHRGCLTWNAYSWMRNHHRNPPTTDQCRTDTKPKGYDGTISMRSVGWIRPHGGIHVAWRFPPSRSGWLRVCGSGCRGAMPPWPFREDDPGLPRAGHAGQAEPRDRSHPRPGAATRRQRESLADMSGCHRILYRL